MNKNLVHYIVLIFIPVFSILLMFEGYLHLINYSGSYKTDGITTNQHFTFDPLTGYSLIPNIDDKPRCITTDAAGNRVTASKADPRKETIAFVGDSTVFGWGVCDSQTYVYQLSATSKFSNFNFINYGVPSYSIAHITEVLENKVRKSQSKIVFVAILWPWKAYEDYGGGDRWKNIDLNFYEQIFPVREKYVEAFSRRMRNWSKAYIFLYDFLRKLKYGDKISENFSRPGVRDFNLSTEDEIAYAEEHIQVLQKSKIELKKAGVTVVYFMHPYQYTVFHEAYQNLGATGYNKIVQELDAIDFKCILTEIHKHTPSETLYIDGSHLSPEGNERFYDIWRELFKPLKDRSDLFKNITNLCGLSNKALIE